MSLVSTMSLTLWIVLAAAVICAESALVGKIDAVNKIEAPVAKPEAESGTELPLNYMVKVYSWKQCDNFTGSAITFENLVLNRVGKDTYTVSGFFHVMKPIIGPFYSYIRIWKCTHGHENCRPYMEKRMEDNICDTFKDPKSIFYDLFHNKFGVEEPKCPLPAMRTKMIPKEIDLTPFIGPIALKGKVWKVDLLMVDKEGVPNSCVHFHCGLEQTKSYVYNFS